MSLRMRASAATAVVAALAVGAPVAGAFGPVPSSIPSPPALNSTTCPRGIIDPGPFGPLGPYGPQGPYGPNGPLHGQPNPIGNAATCGGLLTYILRGGNLSSFVSANVASVGLIPTAAGK